MTGRAAGRIGVDLPDALDVPDRVRLAVWAQEQGFDDVWASEISDPDVFVVLGAVAAATDRVRLGTAIVPLATRTVPSLAAAAASVARLAPGRLALGVGVSTEVIISGWHGLAYERPLERARESVELLRAILAGERSAHDGRQVRSRGFRLRWPPDPAPPVILAAMNERMLELAGAIADGVYLTFVPVDGVATVLASIDRGAERAQRPRPEILTNLVCRVTTDPDGAREEFRHQIAFYLTAPPYQRALSRLGFADDVDRARAAWERRDLAAVAAGASSELLDAIGALGTAEACRERIAAYHAAGVDSVSITALDADPRDTLRALAPAR